jgi:hypothetical protein
MAGLLADIKSSHVAGCQCSLGPNDARMSRNVHRRLFFVLPYSLVLATGAVAFSITLCPLHHV